MNHAKILSYVVKKIESDWAYEYEMRSIDKNSPKYSSLNVTCEDATAAAETAKELFALIYGNASILAREVVRMADEDYSELLDEQNHIPKSEWMKLRAEYQRKIDMLIQKFSEDVEQNPEFLNERYEGIFRCWYRKSLRHMVHTIRSHDGDFPVSYPNLPQWLKPYYVYLLHLGHCACCVPESLVKNTEETGDWDDCEFPIPVKYVLENGCKICGNYIVSDFPYNANSGVQIPKEYYEYDANYLWAILNE